MTNFLKKVLFKLIYILYKFIWYVYPYKNNNVCIFICNSLHYEMVKNIKKNLNNSYITPATKSAKEFLIKNNIEFSSNPGLPKIILSPDFLKNNKRYFTNLSIFVKAILDIKKVKKIQTYHGVVDKNWTYSNYNKQYDLLLVPGKYSKKRLIDIGISETKIKITGFTKFSKHFYKKISKKQVNKKQVVLYAPTYGKISSLPLMINTLIKLSKKFRIIFKPHYYTKEDLFYVKLIKKLNIEVFESDNIEELFSISDILISDTSSIMFEFLLTKKPVIALDFHTWLTGDETLNSENGPEIVYRNLFTRTDNLSKLESLIKKTIINYDYEKNKKIINFIFDKNRNPGKKSALEISRYLKNL